MIIKLIIGAYIVSHTISYALYIPLIYKLYIDKTGAESTSLVAWFGWFGDAMITLFYLIYVTYDPILLTMACLNVMLCAVTSFLALYRRIQFNRER